MNTAHSIGWAVALGVSCAVSTGWAGEREWADLVEAEPIPPASPEDDEDEDRAPSPGKGEHTAAADEPLKFEAGPVLIVPRLQYRLRYRHHEGHDFTTGGVTDTLRHRARFGLAATWPKWSKRLGIVIDLQDVRTLGEEQHTLTDYGADGFDLHQGYGWLRLVRGFEVRFGRQEINYENQRLVGAVDWSEQGRSFDAIRFSYHADELQVDSFYAKIRETNLGLGIADLPSAARHLLGANVHYDMMPQFGAGLVGLADLTGADGKKQATVGAVVSGEVGSATTFHYGYEGYYQFGSAYGALDYSAFLFAADLRLTFDLPASPYLEGYATFLSGDDDPSDLTAQTFEVPFATNHKFYGEMDFFSNMPVDTEERGLRDVGGALGVKPIKGLHLRGAYHLFQAMADRVDQLETFGHELDLKGEYQFWTHARMALVYAVFFPQGLKKRAVADALPEHFVYATADVKF